MSVFPVSFNSKNLVTQHKKLADAIQTLHLMCAIARGHASTCATGLMRVENSMRHFCLTLIVSDIGIKKMKKDQTHQIEWLIIFL